MKRNLGLAIAAGVLSYVGATTTAHAERRAGYVFSDPRGLGAKFELPEPATVSHTIFLNRCAGGCTITPGSNGTQNQSDIIGNATRHVTQFGGTDAQWNAIVSCVKQTYAPFNVTIVDQRPASGDYHTAIIAGVPTEIGQPNGVLGVSPFSCGYLPNAISFSFANTALSNSFGHEYADLADACWTVSQETAHSWGLDHKYDVRDPMTYLPSSSPTTLKVFQNQAGQCGENAARPCSCSYPGNSAPASMNSFALILATFGSGTPDSTPPTVAFQLPNANASVIPGFSVIATATDDVGISKVELRVDGNLAGTSTTSPYQFVTGNSLAQGAHTLELTAYDFANNTTKATETVSYGQTCSDSDPCTDATQVCSSGTCVAGPDTAGGLGSTCTDNSQCASGSCGNDGTSQYCVSACDPAASAGACPAGFGCISAGTGGVCWPGADSGGSGGCSTGGGSSSALMLIGLGLGAVLLTRKRK